MNSTSQVSVKAELLRFYIKLEKNKEQPVRVCEALQAMMEVKGVTSETLRTTGLGKKLRPLKKHDNKDVSSAATKLLEQWMEMVRNEGSEECKDSKGNGSGKKIVAVMSKKIVAEPSSNDKVVNAEEVDHNNEGKQIGSDDTFCIGNQSRKKPDDPKRRKAGELLGQAVALAAKDDDGRLFALQLGFEIEATIAQTFSNNVKRSELDNDYLLNNDQFKLYIQKVRSLHFNLGDSKNPDLRARVLSNEISPSLLCELSSEELASDKKRTENQNIRKKMLEENIRGQQQQASTDQFKCSKCKQRKTTFYQLQTRSADEPMTTFVTCVNCGNRWKFC